MRYDDMRADEAERAMLKAKPRLGSKQKIRLATLSERLSHLPPATPRRAPTGQPADTLGNVYEQHKRSHSSLRERRRDKGIGNIQPMRSRVQRQRRKQRTGGVR